MAAKFKFGKDPLVVIDPEDNSQVTLDYARLKKAALTLRALYHPLRKHILGMIEANKKMPVNQIYKKLKIEQSVASQHLAIMRRAGVVSTVRDGKFIYYSINAKRLAEIKGLVEQLAQEG